MARYDLRHYDGVLAYGEVIRELYSSASWTERAWTWHEAADVRLFRPLLGRERAGELVWIGNWGDGERTAELVEFLLEPARGARTDRLGLRRPLPGRRRSRRLPTPASPYRGWIANHRVPEVFARHAVTVHIPRRPYVETLPGIPTIRPFEALACGIPLVCARRGTTSRGCSRPARTSSSRATATRCGRTSATSSRTTTWRGTLAQHGRRTILARHTCAPPRRRAARDRARARRRHRAGRARPQRRAVPVRIAFFGSSLVSAYWNGAATYYRGLVQRAAPPRPPGRRSSSRTHSSGRRTATSPIPTGPRSSSTRRRERRRCGGRARARRGRRRQGERRRRARRRCSRRRCVELAGRGSRVFWDVDAPATLARLEADEDDPLRALAAALRPRADLRRRRAGRAPLPRARRPGLRPGLQRARSRDAPSRSPPDPRFDADLAFLGNRLPDREARVDEFFLRAAALLPDRAFLLGGTAGTTGRCRRTSALLGHVSHERPQRVQLHAARRPERHSARAWRANGWSPATRVFEAAGAGACLISDAWDGIERVPRAGRRGARRALGRRGRGAPRGATPERARAIGDAARRRVLAEHTYARPGGAGRARSCARRCDGGDERSSSSGLSITSSWGNGHATNYRGARPGARRARARRPLPRARRAVVRGQPRPAGAAVGPNGAVRRSLAELRDRWHDAVARGRRGRPRLVRAGRGRGRRVGARDGRRRRSPSGTSTRRSRSRSSTPATSEYLSRGARPALRPLPVVHRRARCSTGSSAVRRAPRRAFHCMADPELYRPVAAESAGCSATSAPTAPTASRPSTRCSSNPRDGWPAGRFAVAGPQYPPSVAWPANVERHRARRRRATTRRSTPRQRFTLNVTRARHGARPAGRRACACSRRPPAARRSISDRWGGLDAFFRPGTEILVADSTDDVVSVLREVPRGRGASHGRRRAARVLAEHTPARRAAQLEELLALRAAAWRHDARSRRARVAAAGGAASAARSGGSRRGSTTSTSRPATQTAPDHPLGDFPRVKWWELQSALPDDLTGWRVLDVGCNAGFYSFALARRGADVLAIDADEHYLRQARWAARRVRARRADRVRSGSRSTTSRASTSASTSCCSSASSTTSAIRCSRSTCSRRRPSGCSSSRR